MTTLESTKEEMFKNENPISENKQIAVGHGKNQESMLRTSSKKKNKEKKRKKLKKRKKEENVELYHVHGYFWSNLMWGEMFLRLSSLQDKLSIKYRSCRIVC